VQDLEVKAIPALARDSAHDGEICLACLVPRQLRTVSSTYQVRRSSKDMSKYQTDVLQRSIIPSRGSKTLAIYKSSPKEQGGKKSGMKAYRILTLVTSRTTQGIVRSD
jgi:hypothetical protein